MKETRKELKVNTFKDFVKVNESTGDTKKYFDGNTFKASNFAEQKVRDALDQAEKAIEGVVVGKTVKIKHIGADGRVVTGVVKSVTVTQNMEYDEPSLVWIKFLINGKEYEGIENVDILD